MQNISFINDFIHLTGSLYYVTKLGSAYLGDSLQLMQKLPDQSIDLICTSPPFALVRKKEYGNVDAHKYVDWFKNFAIEFHRILKPSGSLVIDIGGSWIKGYPVRSLYQFELVIELCKPTTEGGIGFYLAQELYWYNPAKLPTPAEWVTVRRERVKDAVNTVWWLSKEPHPKANNRNVLRPYSQAMKNLLRNGYDAKLRPSGHDISKKFSNDRGGAIPPNIIDAQDDKNHNEIGLPVLASFNWLLSNELTQPVNVISASNTASNDYYQKRCKQEGIKPHPARFPQALPEFIINLCTEPGDLVFDPFAGSNMTGRVAETLQRRWLAFEVDNQYLQASKFRFEVDAPLVVNPLPINIPNKQKVLELLHRKQETSSSPPDSKMSPLSSSHQLSLPFINEFMEQRKLKFTYGHQFEPEKFSLLEIVQLCQECEPRRKDIENQIAQRYFAKHSSSSESTKASENISKLSRNCFLSLRAYRIVEKVDNDDSSYNLTDLGREILTNKGEPEAAIQIFARHILTNLTGMSLLKAIESINARGDKPQLELIAYELQEMGYSISPNAIYTSTMRKWLELAGVFEREYEINWDTVSEILEIDKDYVDELYTLNSIQKYFLLAMIHLDVNNLTPWNQIIKYATSIYKIRFPSKSFVQEIIKPLVALVFIET